MRWSLILVAVLSAAAPVPFKPDSQGYVGSKACAGCHADVAKKYSATPMGQASGRADSLQLPQGEVKAAKAGAVYSVETVAGKPELHFHRQLPDGTVVEGSKKFTYYLGSGAHGRGFIFQEQGQPFQSPIAYYGKERGWDLAPGYEDEGKIFLGRKVETGCLQCHSSGRGVNAGELFQEGAVSCERCHGPGRDHLAAVQSGNHDLKIVNPAKLEVESRDSVCAQCHLTGEARVLKPGKTDVSFRAGEHLTEHVVPFVWAQPNGAELKVIGHFEGLWRSGCKRAAGDKMSCLTCHDPHTTVAEGDKSAYYRQKCFSCHASSDCKAPVAARTAKGDSCIACHMQTRASTDGQHTAFTDHSISRFNDHGEVKEHSTELNPFWPGSASERDYALAYAQEAWLKQENAGMFQAHRKLKQAWAHSPGDPTVAAELAYTWDLAGDAKAAEDLYKEALAGDPDNLIALTNMGTHLARKGELVQAAELWRRALMINPGLLAPGLNLARAEEAAGHTPAALEIIRRVLSLNPDAGAALEMEKALARPFANAGR